MKSICFFLLILTLVLPAFAFASIKCEFLVDGKQVMPMTEWSVPNVWLVSGKSKDGKIRKFRIALLTDKSEFELAVADHDKSVQDGTFQRTPAIASAKIPMNALNEIRLVAGDPLSIDPVVEAHCLVAP